MPSMEELQALLAEKIAKLDEEHRENTKRSQEEREKWLLDAELERKERLDKYRAQIEAHESEERKKAAAEEKRRREEVAERVAQEQKQAALDEILRLQREKLEWLEKAISEAEFAEEQHRKSLEQPQTVPDNTKEIAVSAEYPQTSANGGSAAEGTSGSTPENPLMPNHLKSILRQATRTY